MTESLQERHAPHNRCFGCGPANERGLRIKSYVAGADVVAHFEPEEHHQAFPGVLSGGIIGTLLDCHSNWTAAYALMKERGLDHPPCTVTAEFSVKLHHPTPLDQVVKLRARPISVEADRVVVESSLEAGGKTTASCRGVFVAVKEGHPAYHRW